jgi:PEP-CTERM motif
MRNPRSRTLKNKRAPLLLAVILAAPAFAFADNIPGHSKTGNNFVSFSEGLTDQQDSQGNSARCNFLLSSIKQNGSNTGSFTMGGKDANLGTHLSTGMASNTNPIKLFDLGANQGASSDKNKRKGPDKHDGDNSGGDGSGVGGGLPSPVIAVPEPGSQLLLLFGLTGAGILFYRRKASTNAV